jgi:hypothetical protein
MVLLELLATYASVMPEVLQHSWKTKIWCRVTDASLRGLKERGATYRYPGRLRNSERSEALPHNNTHASPIAETAQFATYHQTSKTRSDR